MADNIKRYQWKLLRLINDQYNGKVDVQQLEATDNWEVWKSKEINNLIQLHFLKENNSLANSSRRIEITKKGKRILRSYRKEFSDNRFIIEPSNSSPLLQPLSNKSIVDNASTEKFENTSTNAFKWTKNSLIVLLIIWFVGAFFWEAFVNHNKAMLLIWLFLCILITIFSRRKY